MKKGTALFLALVFALLNVTPAFAETDSSKWTLDSISSFFSDILDKAGELADGALDRASQWLDGAWGESSKWIEQAWQTSAAWVTDIWGDVSAWTADTYNSASETVSAWMSELLKKITDNAEKAWDWLKEKLPSLNEEGRDALLKAKETVSEAGAVAEEKLQSAFESVLASLDITADDAEKIWDTVKAYAEQKGLTVISAAKIMLPYLIELKLNQTDTAMSVTAITIAQYLTGVLEKLGIDSDESAAQYIEELADVLDEL